MITTENSDRRERTEMSLMRGNPWILCLVIACGLMGLYVLGCGGGGEAADREIAGDINTNLFLVPAGENWRVTGDLHVTANEIQIDGNLVADAAPGPGRAGIGMVLHSRRSILIGGRVQSGDGGNGGAGQPGGDGGNLELTSDAGRIAVGPGGSIGSGDGGNGGSTASPGIVGGAGGDMTINAPNGEVNLHAHAEVLHLGNGGRGGHIPYASVPTGTAIQFENRGGPTADISLTCATFAGFPLAKAPTGDDWWTDNTEGCITGGRGGDAGALTGVATAEANQVVAPMGAGASVGPLKGADGGDGWLFGGAGQMVSAEGRNGTAGGAGGRGQCTGGDGGRIVPMTLVIEGHLVASWHCFPCFGGPAGGAFSSGGDGGPGRSSGDSGGSGGEAIATGGHGGDAPAGREGEASGHGGLGGNGDAVGGTGGNGRDNCAGSAPAEGGTGGGGGHAGADGGQGGDGGYSGSGGDGNAHGGDGGNGGDGEPPGAGGPFGPATATPGSMGFGVFDNGLMGDFIEDSGSEGSPGGPCPTGGSSETQ